MLTGEFPRKKKEKEKRKKKERGKGRNCLIMPVSQLSRNCFCRVFLFVCFLSLFFNSFVSKSYIYSHIHLLISYLFACCVWCFSYVNFSFRCCCFFFPLFVCWFSSRSFQYPKIKSVLPTKSVIPKVRLAALPYVITHQICRRPEFSVCLYSVLFPFRLILFVMMWQS